MLKRYKELFYGLLFGLGASVIDVSMHGSMEQRGFWTELFRPQVAMAAYRGRSSSLDLLWGWLLWRKNRVERDFRRLLETAEQFRRGISTPAILIHTKLQILLTRGDLHLSPEVEEMVRFAYERSREIGILAEEKLPPTKPT